MKGAVIGFGLLILVFSWAGLRLILREREEADPNRIVLRWAHSSLFVGAREGYNELIRQYEEMHPHVRIVQMPVPSRVWMQWGRTQLIGENPPDLMDLGPGTGAGGLSGGFTTDQQARFFIPLSHAVNDPNPYNAGTHLETVPWRDTFIGSLENPPSYHPLLMQIYGIPKTILIVRVNYNRDLYEEIVGDRPTPKNWREFVALCEDVRDYARRTGRELFPIGLSNDNLPATTQRLFASQTLQLGLQHDYTKSGGRRALRSMAQEFVRGSWDVDAPEITSGLSLIDKVTRYGPPGFMQLRAEDTIFQFSQQRSFMVVLGSFQTSALIRESDFRLGFFDLPLPTPDDPEYGRFTLGPDTEAGREPLGSIGVTRACKHPEQALDFLRFISSVKGVQVMAHHAQWLPPLVGISPPENMSAFEPRLNGYPEGFQISFQGFGRGEAFRLYRHHLHLLGDAKQGAAAFQEALNQEYPAALRRDLASDAGFIENSVQRGDVVLQALRLVGPGTSGITASKIWEDQNLQESAALQNRMILQQHPPATR